MSLGGSVIKQFDFITGWGLSGMNDDYFIFRNTTSTRIKLLNKDDLTPAGTFDITPAAVGFAINDDSTVAIHTEFEQDITAPYDETEYDIYIMKNVEP